MAEDYENDPARARYNAMAMSHLNPALYGSLGFGVDPRTAQYEAQYGREAPFDLYIDEAGRRWQRGIDPGIFDQPWANKAGRSKVVNHPEYGLMMPYDDYYNDFSSKVPQNDDSLAHFALGGGLFAGLPMAAAGAFGAGAQGLFGGASGSASLPQSYWSMIADAGGAAASDAAGAAAGTFGTLPGPTGLSSFLTPNPLSAASLFSGGGGDIPAGAAGAFDAAGMGTGVDAGTMMSNAGLGAGVTGTVFPSISSGGGTSISSFLQGLTPYATGVNALSSLIGAGAARSASNTAADAANNATNAQLGMFNTINQQQAPYREGGYKALSSMLGGVGQGPASGGVGFGQFTHQFGPEDLKTNLAPNYDFMLSQGLGALKNQMNVSGGMVGGNLLRGINDYAQNYASNAYQNAFNNYNANQTNIFNRLSNIAGLGQTANQATGSAGASISPGIANSTIAGGQAQAAGTVGMANAATNGLNNAFGWYALPQIMNAFQGSANG